jgi:hypothetical protein
MPLFHLALPADNAGGKDVVPREAGQSVPGDLIRCEKQEGRLSAVM